MPMKQLRDSYKTIVSKPTSKKPLAKTIDNVTDHHNDGVVARPAQICIYLVQYGMLQIEDLLNFALESKQQATENKIIG